MEHLLALHSLAHRRMAVAERELALLASNGG